MKEPFRLGRLQAGLGARVDAHPPESPLCSSGAKRPFRQLRRSRAGLSHDQRCKLAPGSSGPRVSACVRARLRSGLVGPCGR